MIGLDPFLERSSNPKNDLKKPSSFFYKLDDGRNAEIIMQSCILPHQNDLTYADIESLGGENALRDGQGFYIYRNKRLIIYGTWFRLSGKGIDPELYKYGRIKIDIPNILDEIWEIDIKKQHASIPKDVLNLFKNAVSKICRTSKQKTEKRVRLSLETDDKRIWAKSKTREGKEIFYINSRSKFIENILDTFPDNEKGKVIRILETISATIPFDDIYASVCSRRQNEECLPEMVESIVDLGMLQIDQLSKKKCISLEDALILISQFEPFNDKKIQIKLKERIAYKNGK